jgi:hypothetical protein
MPLSDKREAVPETGVEGNGLPVIRRGAAGIDLGSKSHWVCAPTLDGLAREVREFGATTPELNCMAAWLQERQVESVAMESTGTYWVPVHEIPKRYQKWEVLQRLVDRTRSRMYLRAVKTIFGFKKASPSDASEAESMGSRNRDTCL